MTAFSSYIFLGILTIFLMRKGTGYLFAWFSSGDSRNHLIFARSIFNDGYLNPLTMLQQPVGAPAFLGTLLGWRNGSAFQSSSYLTNDLATYGLTWILFIGLLGVMYAAYLQIFWVEKNGHKELPKYLVALSSLIAVSGVVCGPALMDGFYTAIYGAVSLGIFLLWSLETYMSKTTQIINLVFGMFLLTGILMSWSFLLLVALPIFALVGYKVLVEHLQFKLIGKAVLVALVAVVSFIFTNLSVTKKLLVMAQSLLTSGGSIQPPSSHLFPVVILVIFLILAISPFSNSNINKFLFLSVTIAFASIYALKKISGFQLLSWSYYTLKFQWILLIVFVGISITILFSSVHNIISSKLNVLPRRKLIVSFLLGSIFIYQVSETLYGGQNIWKRAIDGWSQPNASTMNSVIKYSTKTKNPTIFFRYTDPGNQVLGNFWLALYVEPVDPLRGWLYTADTQNNIKFICDVGFYYPKVDIVTRDPSLTYQVRNECGNKNINVIIEPTS